MPRKPKPKNTIPAGQRVALKLEQQNNPPTENEIPPPKKEIKPPQKKELKKPQYASVNVDFAIPTKPIAPMHGMCNGPVSYGNDISNLFKELSVPYVRFSDTNGSISRCGIDISRIFPNFSADENDPSNYTFEYTDKLICAVHNVGAKVIYRLGESVDHENITGHDKIPSDIDKWVRICVNIIRHYNDYWADGFAYGLEYFEIWSFDEKYTAPELANLTCELYTKTAQGIKMYNPNLYVGGVGFDNFDNFARDFIKRISKNKAPLDFVSLNYFSNHPNHIKGTADKFLHLLTNIGYTNTKLIISAWNYIDHDQNSNYNYKKLCQNTPTIKALSTSQKDIKGTSFCVASMLNFNEIDAISSACYFDAQPTMSWCCGICDRFGDKEKTFYAFLAYSEFCKYQNGVACMSLQTDGTLHSGIYAGAGLDREGHGVVLLSSFEGCGMVDLRLNNLPDNLYTADIYMIDGVKNLSLCSSVPLSGMKKRFLLNMSEYGVALIKIY